MQNLSGVAILGLLLPALTSCGMTVVPQGAPGGFMDPSPGPGPVHYVRYEVRCRGCSVCYMSGEETCEYGVMGFWVESVRILGTEIREVWLEATPEDDGNWIQEARILVDGHLAASYEGDGNRKAGETISISARF